MLVLVFCSIFWSRYVLVWSGYLFSAFFVRFLFLFFSVCFQLFLFCPSCYFLFSFLLSILFSLLLFPTLLSVPCSVLLFSVHSLIFLSPLLFFFCWRSHLKVFYKKGFQKYFAELVGKHLCKSLLFNNKFAKGGLQLILKKDSFTDFFQWIFQSF